MLIRQFNNLKPQFKVPFFHCGSNKSEEWNKGEVSCVQSIVKIRLVFNSNQDSINLGLAKYLCNCIYRACTDHMRKHPKLLSQMHF